MKRFLLLFCTVVLIGAIMIVPAFAAEGYSFLYEDVINDSNYGFELPSSSYVLTGRSASSGAMYFESPAFEFDRASESSFEFDNAEYYFSVCIFYDDLGFNFQCDICDLAQEECGLLFDYYPDLLLEFVPVEDGSDAEASPLGSIFDVFGGVGSWIGNQLGSTTSLFWNASTGSLTFLGVLSICALGFALILLLVLLVVRFLRLGG